MDNHKFREAVKVARKCITEKDDFSLSARNLLAYLVYEAGEIKSIVLENLTWFDILKDFSEWQKYYDVNEIWIIQGIFAPAKELAARLTGNDTKKMKYVCF